MRRVLRRAFPCSVVAAAFLVLLAFFQLQRLALLIRHWTYFSSAPGGALAASFLHGLWLDATMAGYLSLPAAVVALAAGLLRVRPATQSAWVGGAALAALFPAAVAGWGELQYFRYFRDRYTFVAVEYADTPGIVWQTIWNEYHPIPVVISALATAWVAWKALRAASPALEPASAPSRPAVAGSWLALAAALVLAIRGGWGLIPIHWGAAYFSPHTAANQLALNGLFSFVSSVRFRVRDTLWAPFDRSFPPEEALSRVRSALEPGGRFDGPGLERRTRTLKPAVTKLAKPSVVLIIMESFSAQASGAVGGPIPSSPEFDKLSAEGLLFTRHLTQGARTGRALFNLLAGTPPPPGPSVLKTPGGRRAVPTLGSIFKEQGYKTRFIAGCDLEFDNMGGFMKQNGFDELVGIGDFDGGRLWQLQTKWGVPDHLILERAHELASKDAGPALTVVLTLTNHPPYKLPPEAPRPFSGELAAERNAVHYADWSLARFFEKARKAGYFDRTLFVVVGDHAMYYEGVPASPLAEFHVPFLIYGPRVLKARPARFDRVTSHSDLSQTIAGVLPDAYRHAFWGRDLLRPPVRDLPVLISSARTMWLVEDGLAVEDDPHGPARAFRFRKPFDLEPAGPVEGRAKALLDQERAFTQVLRRLTRP